MNVKSGKVAGLAALLLVMMTSAAMGQDAKLDDELLRQQLDEAREDLDRARERVAELSKQLGEERRVEIRTFDRKRPMLGFVLGVNDGKGVRLDAVTPDGPADRAGLRSGDVITGIDGRPLTGVHAAERIGEAQRRLGGLKDGQNVVLDYERDGAPAQVTVTAEPLAPFAFLGDLGAMHGFDIGRLNIDIDVEKIQDDIERSMGDIEKRIHIIGPMLEETIRFDAWRWQGLRLAPLDADLGRYFGTQQGVLVLKAEGEALGELRSGDVIQSIGGKEMNDPKDAMRTLADADPGERIDLVVLRDKRHTGIVLTAPERPDMMRLFLPPEPPPPPPPPEAPPPPPPPASLGRVI